VHDHVGELAALGTATCWAMTAIFFAAAGRRVGSLAVNLLRLVIALAILCAFEAVVRGHALPLDAGAHAWSWLTVSGLVGFTFGDLCLFRALVTIGPRLSSLIMSAAPPLTAIIGFFVLGETLDPIDGLGMALTVAGIAWAILERAPADATVQRATGRELALGVVLALGGALGQAGGLVLSKLGMQSFDPFASTQIRVIAGIVGFSIVFTVLRRWGRVRAALHDRRALAMTTLGAVFGPFLGVSLSLLAVQHTATGIAASIMALSPILIIPMVVLLGRERVGVGGIAGAILAVAGVALLFR
jgi:drug/metabolite transporter (DMT)-like permease